MLSSVLGSSRAIMANIQSMRTFVRVRALAATHSNLAKRRVELEVTTEALAMNHVTFSHNNRARLKKVRDALRELMMPLDSTNKPIGFINPEFTGSKEAGGKKRDLTPRLFTGDRRHLRPTCTHQDIVIVTALEIIDRPEAAREKQPEAPQRSTN